MPKIIIQIDGDEQTVELKRAVTSIGRDDTNDVRIGDPSVSGRHCRIERTDQGYTVVDLGGKNGTRVNGRKIKEHNLEPQDKIEIGRTAIYFERKPAPLECCVQVLNGTQKGKLFDLKDDISTLGRNESCACILQEDSVSNFHAAIERSGSSFVIRDLHSRNGTFVDGAQLGERPVVLQDAAQLQLGNSKMVFYELVPVAGVEPPPSQRAAQQPAAAAPAQKAAGAARVAAPQVPTAPAAEALATSGEIRRELLLRPRRRSRIVSILGVLVVIGFIVGIVYAVRNMDLGSIMTTGPTTKGNGDLLDGYGTFGGEGGAEKQKHWKFEGENVKGWKVENGALVAPATKGPAVSNAVCDKTVPVDQAKVYGLRCKLRSEGEHGLNGLKIVWTNKSDPGYFFESFSNLAAGKADVHEIKDVLYPPAQAGELRVACVTIGNPAPVSFHSVELVPNPRPGYAGPEGGGARGMGVELGERGMVTIIRPGGVVVWGVQLCLVTKQDAEIWQKYCTLHERQPQEYSSTLMDPMTLTPIDFHVIVQADKAAGGVVIRHTIRAKQKLDMKSIGLAFMIRKSDIPHGVLVGQDLGAFIKDGEFEASNVSEAVFGHGDRRIVAQSGAPSVNLTRKDIGETAQIIFWMPIEVLEENMEAPVEFYFKMSSVLADGEVEKLKRAAEASVLANEIGDALRHLTAIVENPYYPEKDRKEAEKKAKELQKKADALFAETEKAIEKFVAEPKDANEEMARAKLKELKIALAEERLEGGEGGVVFVIVSLFKDRVDALTAKLDARKNEEQAKAEEDVKKLLASAEKFEAAEQWMIARVFYDNVIKKAPNSEEAKEARKRIDGLAKKQAKVQERNKDVDRKLTAARNYERNKMIDRAAKTLVEIIEKYPDAPGAKEAIPQLEKIVKKYPDEPGVSEAKKLLDKVKEKAKK
ncbi:MAG: FHA domain-containing protein [Planctomycetota bacterium]